MPVRFLIACLSLALAGCSDPGAAARVDGNTVRAASAPALIQGKTIAMSASKPCGTSNLERSLCMMELMIDDIRKNYDWPSGGGIESIKGVTSTSYTVSLPQEERTDLFTYEFDVSPTAVTMKSKTSGTQSY